MSKVMWLIVVAGLLSAGQTPAGEWPEPANALWVLEFGNIAQGNPITVRLATTNGKVVRCFGHGFNRAVHTVDASALKVVENGLKGPMKITVNPDQWFPADGKITECVFDIDVLAKNGNAGGKFKGTVDGKEAVGMIVGALQIPSKAIPGKTIAVSLEQALKGEVNQQRVEVVIPIADGKVGNVKASGKNSRAWSAEVKETGLTVTSESLTGEMKVEVKSSGSVTSGVYTFVFDGQVIGTRVAGTFKSKLDGSVVRDCAMFSVTVQ